MPSMGLGTAPLAGLYEAVTPETARATVDAAWALGVRFFDTAPLYGSGLAERRLGEALADRPRGEYTLSTKVGRLLRPGTPNTQFPGAPPLEPVFDFSPEGVRRSLAGSLERLGLEYVDIVFLHDPEAHLHEVQGAIEAVRDLAPRVGVGTNVVATALALVERREVDVVLLAGRYTVLDRSAGDELLPLCAQLGLPLIAAGVFNSGLLAGGSTFDYGPVPAAILARCAELDALCARHEVPLAAAAIQFPLRHPGVASILVGARSPAEVDEDVRLLSVAVPEELWAELGAIA